MEEFPSNILPRAAMISGIVVGLISMRGLWFSIRRMLVINQLRGLADNIGGSLPQNSTRESVRKFIDWEGMWVAQFTLGAIPKNSGQCEKLIESSENTITRLTNSLD